MLWAENLILFKSDFLLHIVDACADGRVYVYRVIEMYGVCEPCGGFCECWVGKKISWASLSQLFLLPVFRPLVLIVVGVKCEHFQVIRVGPWRSWDTKEQRVVWGLCEAVQLLSTRLSPLEDGHRHPCSKLRPGYEKEKAASTVLVNIHSIQKRGQPCHKRNWKYFLWVIFKVLFFLSSFLVNSKWERNYVHGKLQKWSGHRGKKERAFSVISISSLEWEYQVALWGSEMQ